MVRARAAGQQADRPLAFFLRLLRRRAPVLVGAILASLAAAAADAVAVSLVFPLVSALAGQAPTTIAPGPLRELFAPFERMDQGELVRTVAVLLLGAALVKHLLQYVALTASFYLQSRVNREARTLVFERILLLDLRRVHHDRLAKLFTLLNHHTVNVSGIAHAIAPQLSHLFLLIVLVVYLLSISPGLTILAGAFLAGTSFLMRSLTRRSHAAGLAQNVAAERLNAMGWEQLSALRMIRLFGREDLASSRFRAAVTDFTDRVFDQGRVYALVGPLYSFTTMLGIAVLLLVGSFIIADGTLLTLPLLVTFLAIISRMTGPAAALNDARVVVAALWPSTRTLADFLAEPVPTADASGGRGLTEFREIRFDEVSFRYTTDAPTVLSNVDLRIVRGMTTAIVGPSGAGKSTLVDLLCRLYPPTSGRIHVDGEDARSFSLASWRSVFAIVDQDTFLFDASVADNILFGRPDASREEVVAAAKLANAHDFIAELPDGYGTRLGDRGVRLSGGQRQRIALARALVRRPLILVLDEATSALDSVSERLVHEAIQRIATTTTVIVVAHRLSTVQEADHIVVLEAGRIVETGMHADLVIGSGLYATLARMQALAPSAAR